MNDRIFAAQLRSLRQQTEAIARRSQTGTYQIASYSNRDPITGQRALENAAGGRVYGDYLTTSDPSPAPFVVGSDAFTPNFVDQAGA